MSPNTNPTGKTTFIRQCRRKHCTFPATVIPIIRIPAVDCCIRPDSDLSSGPMDFPLCGHHFMTFAPGEVLTAKVQTKLRRACKGGAKPDFRRAYKQSAPFVPKPETLLNDV
jgi:hypothetical protein